MIFTFMINSKAQISPENLGCNFQILNLKGPQYILFNIFFIFQGLLTRIKYDIPYRTFLDDIVQ